VKILHVLPDLAPGGMEQLAIQLASDATDHGDRVVIASGPGAWVAKATAAGAEHLPLPATSRSAVTDMAAAIARLGHGMRQLRPHVVHAHNVRATALARLALLGARHQAALVPTLHGVDPRDYRAASRVFSITARRVIACAPAVARSLQAAGFPGDKIDVITNGAALLPADHERQANLRRSLDLGQSPLVVGIGRLAEQKNWPAFIEAASHLNGPCFAIAGEGPLRQKLVDLASRHANPVKILGFVGDIPALVGIASCVVSTSTWEGLPLALLEALSLGTPVVATAVDGITDLVPVGAALLVPPGDPAAVSAAISRVLSDDSLATSLRAAALEAAVAWRPERMLGQYRSAYQAAVAGQPRWVSAQHQLPPAHGPQSDQDHPSMRGVSSEAVIDKAPKVGGHCVWERGKLPEDGGTLSLKPGMKPGESQGRPRRYSPRALPTLDGANSFLLRACAGSSYGD
jgi:glycosyltransferase involved in cell wall biosynthesis